MYAEIIKPIFDIVTAIILLIIFLPVIFIVSILLSISLFGLPFFLQERPGKNERVFKILKFKTMNDDKDDKGILLPDERRLTMMGKFVRKLSMDELPQLINVIFGDMSFVGPRPLLPEYLPFYTDEQKKRHWVKPGITGLAQVKGRNTMVFSERLKYDVYYVENQSFLFDLKILFLTIYTVFFKSRTIIPGQTVDEVDDIGLSRNLSANHFKKDKE